MNLNELFYYDEECETKLRNKVSRGRSKADSVAGSLHHSGYYYVRVGSKTLAVHRIIFELCNRPIEIGEVIDHINGNPIDNSVENLRAVNRKMNSRNAKKRSDNSSGFTGIRFRRDSSRWVANWRDESGRWCTKSFKVRDSDCITAKVYAKLWRETQISNLGYTERHGK